MKRETTESKIISYFSEESDEKVNLLFGIVKGIVAKRTPKKPKAGKKATAQTLNSGGQILNSSGHSGPVSLGKPETGRVVPVVDSKAS